MLPLNLSDTAATSQDGSSLEFIAPIAGGSALFMMQVAEGCEYDFILMCIFSPVSPI